MLGVHSMRNNGYPKAERLELNDPFTGRKQVCVNCANSERTEHTASARIHVLELRRGHSLSVTTSTEHDVLWWKQWTGSREPHSGGAGEDNRFQIATVEAAQEFEKCETQH